MSLRRLSARTKTMKGNVTFSCPGYEQRLGHESVQSNTESCGSETLNVGHELKEGASCWRVHDFFLLLSFSPVE